MRSDIIKLLATVVIWGAMAFIITEVRVSEGNVFPLILIMGIVAVISTAVVWIFGGRGSLPAEQSSGKAKRTRHIPNLVEDLDEQERAELEDYLQAQRESRLRQ